ncbi:TetR/AcrR family transcriptional regulator [Streptomyces sp. A5-4]|uniref:TetR/AcrR family transcriptional regulator n=1 Tax=Streptomyces sp. A5-4 TaxID=3384771 RepID=UPI003DA88FED
MAVAGSKDPRTARTRGRLREALLAACEEQPLEQVAVADVVRRAGVGRATFYLHYDDLHTLAVDACAGLVRDAVDALHAWETPPGPERPPGALVDLLDAVRARAAVHRSLLRPGGGGPLGELLHEELMRRSLAERRQRRPGGGDADEAVASAVAALFTGVLADWVHGRVAGTPPELAARVWRMLVALQASHGRVPPHEASHRQNG